METQMILIIPHTFRTGFQVRLKDVSYYSYTWISFHYALTEAAPVLVQFGIEALQAKVMETVTFFFYLLVRGFCIFVAASVFICLFCLSLRDTSLQAHSFVWAALMVG